MSLLFDSGHLEEFNDLVSRVVSLRKPAIQWEPFGVPVISQPFSSKATVQLLEEHVELLFTMSHSMSVSAESKWR